jgi:hypothetical protein
VFRNLGVKVKREITEALKNSQADPTSQISFPAALILLKIPSDDIGALEWPLGEDSKNRRNAQKAIKGKPALSQTLIRHPNCPPTEANMFKDRIVPRGIAVLRSPIAKPSCRPLNHWARAWGVITNRVTPPMPERIRPAAKDDIASPEANTTAPAMMDIREINPMPFCPY